MKLVRYGPVGAEKPGILDAGGKIRDLSQVVPDIAGSVLSLTGLADLARVDVATLPLVTGAPRLGAPVIPSRNFICIGLNYEDHAAETGAAIPKEPIVFIKSLSAVCGPNDDIVIPRDSLKTDWEVELLVVIGQKAHDVPEAAAFDYVAGYATCIDVSEREWQYERGGNWDKGKGFDTFGPIGPWLVTRDEISDPQNLDLFTDVDGRRMQNGNTGRMIFPVRTLVSYVSRCITLYPGDVIATGTPPGVALGMKPPAYLRSGQIICSGVAGLGEHRHTCVTS